MKRCPACGEARRLGPDGFCVWRAGCEHRAMILEAREVDLERELAAILDPPMLPQWSWLPEDYPVREASDHQIYWIADDHRRFNFVHPDYDDEGWPFGE